MLDMKEIGLRLKRVRKQLGYSQEYVAIRLHTNISRISNIETAKMIPDILEILRFCDVYETTLPKLLSLSEKQEYHLEETSKIITGLSELDDILKHNQSMMLNKWFKTIHSEITEIIREVQMLQKLSSS